MEGATTQVDHCPVCDSALPTDPGESNCTTCGSAIHPRIAEGRAVAEQGRHPYLELVGTTLSERYQILNVRGRGAWASSSMLSMYDSARRWRLS